MMDRTHPDPKTARGADPAGGRRTLLRSPLAWLLLWPSLLTTVFVGGFLVANVSVALSDLEPEASGRQAAWDAFHDEFDDAVFAAHRKVALALQRINAGPRGGANAGSVLNSKVRWVPEQPDWRALQGVASASLVLSPDQEEWLDVLGEAWPFADRSLYETVDLSWMDGLENYGRWDIMADSPIEAHLRAGTAIEWLQAPTPDVLAVSKLVRLRLAKGIAEGEVEEAIADATDVARLLVDQELMSSVAIATSILADARVAWLAANQAGLSPAPEIVLRPAELKAMRQIRSTLRVFAGHLTPSAARARFEEASFGRCAAIHNAVLAFAAFQTTLAFDISEPTRRILEARIRDSSCRGVSSQLQLNLLQKATGTDLLGRLRRAASYPLCRIRPQPGMSDLESSVLCAGSYLGWVPPVKRKLQPIMLLQDPDVVFAWWRSDEAPLRHAK